MCAMKKILPCLCVLAMLASGCARYYQITLQNGHKITTQGKPKYENGKYVYRDINGQTNSVSGGSVRIVEPQPRGYTEDSNFNPSGRK